MVSSSATSSSLSSFSDECDTSLPEPPPPIDTTNHGRVSGKKPVHKVEPVFDSGANKMRIFLEDGSLTEYPLRDTTTAEELVGEMASRHGLGSDMRRYRLTLCETRDASWRSIRFIRPQQKLKDVAQCPNTTPTNICTLRVVIVPIQAESLADTEPITFTYLYRQSINDYVRERAGSEVSVDVAVQLTALLVLDESLCTGVRVHLLLKRSWLLKQLLPRSLLDQFSLKQLTNQIRNHLHENAQTTQLSVARQFVRIFAENTRSFAGKLFPVKFPDKHRDTILLVGPRYPIAVLDQARRINSPVISLVSAWSHLSRVIVKQYRNGVAIRLLTTPTAKESPLLHQEIAFLLHSNLLNDFIALVEGYAQLESTQSSLAIERISLIGQSSSSSRPQNNAHRSSDERESLCRSPLVQRILPTRKNRRTYSLTQHQDKQTPPGSPSLFNLTRRFFTRSPTKTVDMDERETVSNVPNRTTLVTWRSIADTQTSPPSTPPPPPILYRTIINVTHKGQMAPINDDDDNDIDEPDVIDLTTSYGYYGSLSFPVRPPSPFADGLIWPRMPPRREMNDDHDDDSEGIVLWSPSTKQLSVHYNTNNSNNSGISSSHTGTWRRTFDRIVKRNKLANNQKGTEISSCEFYNGSSILTGGSMASRGTVSSSKRVHWIDDDETILTACHRFVAHLKSFVQSVINNNVDNNHLIDCKISLNELHTLIDCQELKQAFDRTVTLAQKRQIDQLLEQQTCIAQLLSRAVLSASSSSSSSSPQ